MAAYGRRRTAEPEISVKGLEERLHQAHQQLALLADVFDLQAIAPDYVQNGPLSSEACDALAGLSRQEPMDIRRLLDELPPSLKNWSAGSSMGQSGEGAKR